MGEFSVNDCHEGQDRPMPQVERIADEAEPDCRPVRQQHAVEPGLRSSKNDEEGACNRQHCRHSRIRGSVRHQEQRAGYEQESDCRYDSGGPSGQGCATVSAFHGARQAPVGPSPDIGNVRTPSKGRAGQHTAGQQLPEPRKRQKKRVHRRRGHLVKTPQERTSSNNQQTHREFQSAGIQECQKYRENQIKLFLYSKTPQVNQRLVHCCDIDVPYLPRKHNIRYKESTPCNMFAEKLVFLRK